MNTHDPSRREFVQHASTLLAGAALAVDVFKQALSGVKAVLHTRASNLYGTLDTAPTEVVRNFGFSWGMGGWLLFLFLQKIGPAAAQTLRERVAAELATTFASHYAHEVSLAGALQMEAIAVYGKRSTGTKFLINPTL